MFNLPSDIFYNEVTPNCSFETIISIYTCCSESVKQLNDKNTLNILARKFDIIKGNINNFNDFIIYGCIMAGSDISLKYHSGTLCAVSGAKFGNRKLIELGEKKEEAQAEREQYIINKHYLNLMVAGSIENNQIEMLTYLLKTYGSYDHAIMSSVINNNLLLLNNLITFINLEEFDIEKLNLKKKDKLYCNKLDLTNIKKTLVHNMIYYSVLYNRNNIFKLIYTSLSDDYLTIDNLQSIMMIASKGDNIDILDLISKKLENLINKQNIDILLSYAISYNNLNSIKWIYNYSLSKNIIPKFPKFINNLEMIIYLVDHHGYDNFSEVINTMGCRGNIEGVKYGYSKLLESYNLNNLNDLNLVEIINKCSIKASNFMDILEYLEKLPEGKSLPYNEIGMETNKLEILKWSCERGFNKYGDKMVKSYYNNYDIFLFCLEYVNDNVYYDQLMKAIELDVCVGETSKNSALTLEILLEKKIATILCSEEINDIFSILEDETEHIENIVSMEPDDNKPSILKYKYFFGLIVSLNYDHYTGFW